MFALAWPYPFEWLPWPVAAGLGGALGLSIGSFLATLLVRWPQGRSANTGRSQCDGCGRQLRFFELIPLLSWVIVRGRCRSCHATIDPVHPAIEAICGIGGAVAFAAGGPLLAPMIWLLVVLFFFDALYLWLPDRLVGPLAAACLLAPALSDDVTLVLRLAGGAIGFATLWLIAAAYRRRTGVTGLGGGDAKLFGAIGLWCGALQLPVVLLVGCTIGFADVARRIWRGESRTKMQLPLGSYLVISTLGLIVTQGFVP